jgi:hypothetical protein
LPVADSTTAPDTTTARPLIDDITWTAAFLFGSQSRGVGETGALEVQGGYPIELYLVLEGERDGLPVYCTTYPNFRLNGRAIPQRMIVQPREVGLGRTEIHWVSLHTTDGSKWRRAAMPAGDGRWSFPVERFPEDEEDERQPSFGTMRVAAAVDVKGTPQRVLETPGWNLRGTASNPPGFFVSRVPNGSLVGLVRGYVGVSVDPSASVEQRRGRIAMRAIDVVLGPYEDLGSGPLPGPRDEALDAPAWSWLMESVTGPVFARTTPQSPFVTAQGRAVHWANHASKGETALQPGDVLVGDGRYALVENDDGDGWFGSGDAAVLADESGVHRGTLETWPARTFQVLRARDFSVLRSRLATLGYGSERMSSLFDAALARSVRSFQVDQGLPETGVPDEATLHALTELETRMSAADATEEKAPDR